MEERDLGLSQDVAVVGTVKEPNTEEIIALDPDLVILASDIAAQADIRDVLENAGLACATFQVDTFEDYAFMMEQFCAITGRDDLYEENVTQVGEQIEQARATAAQGDSQPQVLLIRAFSSGIKAKTDDELAGAILKDLGAHNIADDHPSMLEDLSMEEVIAADPAYIFVTTMGDEQKALDYLNGLIEENPAWSELTAVKEGRYIVLPKDLFHYKPNNRWGRATSTWGRSSTPPCSMRGKAGLGLVVLGALVVLSAALGTAVGSTFIHLPTALGQLFSGNTSSSDARILLHVRLPRVAASLLCGAALSVSGMLIQAVLSNALASPNVIGVNAGGGILHFFGHGAGARVFRGRPHRGLFRCAACHPHCLRRGCRRRRRKADHHPGRRGGEQYLHRGHQHHQDLFPGHPLQRQHLFDRRVLWGELCRYLPGVDDDPPGAGAGHAALPPHRCAVPGGGNRPQPGAAGKRHPLWVDPHCLCAGRGGGELFRAGELVGLLCPHIVRRLFGQGRHRVLLPAAALLGASFVTLCDLLSRVLFAPYEIPVGILLSFFGRPLLPVLNPEAAAAPQPPQQEGGFP